MMEISDNANEFIGKLREDLNKAREELILILKYPKRMEGKVKYYGIMFHDYTAMVHAIKNIYIDFDTKEIDFLLNEIGGLLYRIDRKYK